MARDKEFLLDVARLLVVAAWADGEATNSEINQVKHALLNLPEFSAQDWGALQALLHHPPDAHTREIIQERVRKSIRSRADEQFVMDFLRRVVEADGRITPEEQEMLDQAEEALRGQGGLLGRLGALLGLSQRPELPSEDVEDFLQNRIFFEFEKRWREQGRSLDLPRDTVRRLCLAAGIMAHVAGADDESLPPEERDAIRRSLEGRMDVPGAEPGPVAEVMAKVITDPAFQSLEIFPLTRGFRESSTPEQRQELVETLFHVAAADGQATHDEIETIRQVANLLGLSHRAFIDAKRTLPRHERPGH